MGSCCFLKEDHFQFSLQASNSRLGTVEVSNLWLDVAEELKGAGLEYLKLDLSTVKQ